MTTVERPQIDLPPTGPPYRTVIIEDSESPAQRPYGDRYRTSIVTIRDYDWQGNLIDHDAQRAEMLAEDLAQAQIDEVAADHLAHLVAKAVRHVCGSSAQFDDLTTALLLGNRWLGNTDGYSLVEHSNMDSHFRGWWGDLKVIDDYTVSLTHTSPNCE